MKINVKIRDEKLQYDINRYHQVKLINMNILQLNK